MHNITWIGFKSPIKIYFNKMPQNSNSLYGTHVHIDIGTHTHTHLHRPMETQKKKRNHGSHKRNLYVQIDKSLNKQNVVDNRFAVLIEWRCEKVPYLIKIPLKLLCFSLSQLLNTSIPIQNRTWHRIYNVPLTWRVSVCRFFFLSCDLMNR